jgi:hypothetical protein
MVGEFDENTSVLKSPVSTASAIDRKAICYMDSLSPKMPSSDNVLRVFYDFQTTRSEKVTERHPTCAKFSLRSTILHTV